MLTIFALLTDVFAGMLEIGEGKGGWDDAPANDGKAGWAPSNDGKAGW